MPYAFQAALCPSSGGTGILSTVLPVPGLLISTGSFPTPLASPWPPPWRSLQHPGIEQAGAPRSASLLLLHHGPSGSPPVFLKPHPLVWRHELSDPGFGAALCSTVHIKSVLQFPVGEGSGTECWMVRGAGRDGSHCADPGKCVCQEWPSPSLSGGRGRACRASPAGT